MPGRSSCYGQIDGTLVHVNTTNRNQKLIAETDPFAGALADDGGLVWSNLKLSPGMSRRLIIPSHLLAHLHINPQFVEAAHDALEGLTDALQQVFGLFVL